ncbi:MAG TPA: glycosyltransferase family 2 protein [Bacteroidales bacterium]|nr:glycosyltransferase family 2 protein [Bacteroidales bacterium]
MGTATQSIISSLIVTTYNSVPALQLVLESILQLHIFPHELIIADDGSTDDTKKVIELYKPRFSIPVHHCWQPDEGFQLSKIRNKAIAMATGNYIIMIDGDMVLHRNFVRDHMALAQSQSFIQGSRVLVSQNTTMQLYAGTLRHLHMWSQGIQNRLNAYACLPISYVVSSVYGKKDYRGVRGCNMSFWKHHVLAVNGFDEDFIGWGREDSEFVVRMLNSGVQRKNIKFAGIAFHLWHKENKQSEQALAENQALLDAALHANKTICSKGINQYVQ